jgi:hypothetical protein
LRAPIAVSVEHLEAAYFVRAAARRSTAGTRRCSAIASPSSSTRRSALDAEQRVCRAPARAFTGVRKA